MDISVVRVNAIRKIRPLHRDVKFALDEGTFRQDASENLMLSGWVVHRKGRIVRVTLSDHGRPLAHGSLVNHRPRVQELYPDYPNASRAGFKFDAPSLPIGEYELLTELENGKSITLASITLEPHRQPKLLFMHIPKAAGSTVNHYFASHYSRTHHAVHIEGNPDWKNDPGKIRALDFVAGHVPLPVLATKLNLDDYFKVTVVREPYTQLVSHIAWIRRLADPGEEHRLEMHPPYVKKLARKLEKTDLSRPEVIEALDAGLEEAERRLLDNCQTRYFCGTNPVSKDDLEMALAASATFDKIGIAAQLDEFLADVAMKMGWRNPQRQIPMNVSGSHYGMDLQNTKFREALEPLVHYDLQLFNCLRSSTRHREGLMQRMKLSLRRGEK